jgi:hypothetical protein
MSGEPKMPMVNRALTMGRYHARRSMRSWESVRRRRRTDGADGTVGRILSQISAWESVRRRRTDR